MDLTDLIIKLENEKKKAAREMSQEYHMIWYGKAYEHIEKRVVDVEEIFMMFPEISPAFFKHFDVEEFTFRFKGGTATFIRKEK